jgi:hypothetical protein
LSREPGNDDPVAVAVAVAARAPDGLRLKAGVTWWAGPSLCKAQSLFKISREEAGNDGYRASWRVISDYGRICLRWQRTVRSSLYGSMKRAMRMADAIF